MFTKKELASLVPRTIFERGRAYYEDDEAVVSIRQQGDVFTATVRGTATYRVSLQIRATGPPEIQCNCPYDYGPVCKHGIALGLAVLGLAAAAGTIAQPAPPEKRSKAEQSTHILKGAWARTSDKQKLDFLRQLLAQKPKQLRRFLAAFEFDEKVLARLPAQTYYAARPATAPPQRPAPPRRVPSLAEQAQQLLEQQRGPELLPLVLALNWLQNPPLHDSHTLPYLLGEAARFQPEATLDAVMERFEGYLEDKSLRNHWLYNQLVACLKALALLPALTRQVQLFASELMQQYRPLRTLQTNLGRAGFVIIVPEEATGLPPKPRKRPPGSDGQVGLPRRRPKPEAAVLPPKRRGRPKKGA